MSVPAEPLKLYWAFLACDDSGVIWHLVGRGQGHWPSGRWAPPLSLGRPCPRRAAVVQPGPSWLVCPWTWLSAAGRKEGWGLFWSPACSPGRAVISLSGCLDGGVSGRTMGQRCGWGGGGIALTHCSWAGPGVTGLGTAPRGVGARSVEARREGCSCPRAPPLFLCAWQGGCGAVSC